MEANRPLRGTESKVLGSVVSGWGNTVEDDSVVGDKEEGGNRRETVEERGRLVLPCRDRTPLLVGLDIGSSTCCVVRGLNDQQFDRGVKVRSPTSMNRQKMNLAKPPPAFCSIKQGNEERPNH
jgi:hypothetical protein